MFHDSRIAEQKIENCLEQSRLERNSDATIKASAKTTEDSGGIPDY